VTVPVRGSSRSATVPPSIGRASHS
jgi:hypothetical protein